MNGPILNAWWFNPRDGQVYDANGDPTMQPFATYDNSATSQRLFNPPGNSATQDWVLVLDDATRGYTIPGKTSVTNDADFDGDGDTDGADFLAWQRGFGTPNATLPDGDADGDKDVDGDDLFVWQSNFNATGGTGAFQQDGGPQGIVSIEAENFDANTPRGGDSWNFVTTPTGFSGTAAMFAGPNDGDNINTGYSTTSPQLDYQVNFVKTGIHYVWVLGNRQDSGFDDSLHIGLGGVEIATSDRVNFGGTTSWVWTNQTMDSAVATFNVTETGIQTLNAWMREDGLTIDKIVLTTDSAFVPTGFGPAESPRGGALRLASDSRPASTDVAAIESVPPDLIERAAMRWIITGANASRFENFNIQVRDLRGDLLGVAYASTGTIYVGSNAAGRGWYVDPNPWDDYEFEGPLNDEEGVDLLSVLAHEMGHLLGLGHDDSGDGVMGETLGERERRLPSHASAYDFVFERLPEDDGNNDFWR